MVRPSSRRLRAAYHHGDLRRVLLDAALRLVEEKGVDALSLREAARIAGVTHQAPYRHFEDKTALLAALAEEGFRMELVQLGTAVAENSGDSAAQLTALGVAHVKFAVEHAALFRLMFGPQMGDKSEFPSLRAVADAVMAVVTTTIAGAQREGILRRDDPLDLAIVYWSALHGLASLIIERPLARYPQGHHRPEDLARLVVGTIFIGTRVPVYP